jgi:outer membrane murein-binding lipoprotein Lpp
MKNKLTLATAALFALTLPAGAQNETVQDLAKQWSNLRDATLKLAGEMPDDRYDFRPVNGGVSFAEQLVTMARSVDAHFAGIAGGRSPFEMPNSLGADTVRKLAADAFDYGAKTIDGLKESDLDRARPQVLAAIAEASQARRQADSYLNARHMVTAEEADRRKFLFYGFLAAWLLLCLYVVAVSLRERRLRGELDRVKRLVEDREHDKPEQIRL